MRGLIGLLWLALVLWLASRHAFWRDEVRALSLALQGATTFAMLRGLHGEGHPAIWYLLLRGAHALVATPKVLPVVAFLASGAAIGVLLWRAPFRWPLVALIALSHFAVFEYSVSARNYGISMLVLFVLAAGYARWRRSGWAIGGLLFLLANTNAHSVLLAACFLAFWIVDSLADPAARTAATRRALVTGAALAALGIAACFVTIYPPFNDATAAVRSHVPFAAIVDAITRPAHGFTDMVADPWGASFLGGIFWDYDTLLSVMSAAMFASVLGLARFPAAALCGLASLVAFSVFFECIYPGHYRHEALWLVFMIALYWICAARVDGLTPSGAAGRVMGVVSGVGRAAFALLLFIQLPATLDAALDSGPGAAPFSRSADFARFMAGRPDLKDATLLADPDYLLEPLPYYLDNPTWLLREHRFGRVVIFTRSAQLRLSLDEMLQRAHELQATTGKPVLMLLTVSLDRVSRPVVVHEGYDWDLALDPGQVERFRHDTTLIDRERNAKTDETFDVYLLNALGAAS